VVTTIRRSTESALVQLETSQAIPSKQRTKSSRLEIILFVILMPSQIFSWDEADGKVVEYSLARVILRFGVTSA
jgi:hypothetical protein